ncbi:hypothetical protein DLE04_01055 [Actinobacteria bacterium IMCC26103]|nr:hypothetical protein DLE04_01055 [Actinobacteria bacterium IMCC26103]
MDRKLKILNKKHIVVAGSKGMLGESLVQSLENQGATVYQLDLNNKPGENKFECDITDKAQVKQALSEIKSKTDNVTGIVNLAAINPTIDSLGNNTRLSDFNFSKDLESISLTYSGTLNLVSELEDLLSEYSSVVLVGSDLSLISPDQRIYCNCNGSPEMHKAQCSLKPPSYSFEKFGLIGLTKYLSTYFGPKGIRVNCICPGPVDTDFSENFRRRLVERTPMGRLATTKDLNSSIQFLLSDMSDFVTGVALPVDGGRSVW